MLGTCPEGHRPTTRQALTPSISVWERPDTEGYTRPLHKPVQTPSLASWQRIDPMATDYLTVEASRRPIRIEQASEPSLGIGYSVSTQTTTTDVRRKRKTHGRKNATRPSQAPGLACLSLGWNEPARLSWGTLTSQSSLRSSSFDKPFPRVSEPNTHKEGSGPQARHKRNEELTPNGLSSLNPTRLA